MIHTVLIHVSAAVQHARRWKRSGPESGAQGTDIAAWIDGAPRARRGRTALLALLPEQHPLYHGRSANEITRIRALLLAAFARVGLPARALPYVVEELESGIEAYAVASAARALQGMARLPESLIPFLLRAVENIRYSDDTVTFAEYLPRWPLADPAAATTAQAEIFRTLGQMAGRAQSALPALQASQMDARSRAALDQAVEAIRAGRSAAALETFASCCSLDAGFRPVRIGWKARGSLAKIDGLILQDQDGRKAPFSEFFFVTDGTGDISGTATRLRWNAADERKRIRCALRNRSDRSEGATRTVSLPFARSLALALFRKCPICWGAYLSALGIGGAQKLISASWLFPVCMILLALHLGIAFRRAIRTSQMARFAISAAGAALLILGRLVMDWPLLSLAGAVAIVCGSIMPRRAPRYSLFPEKRRTDFGNRT